MFMNRIKTPSASQMARHLQTAAIKLHICVTKREYPRVIGRVIITMSSVTVGHEAEASQERELISGPIIQNTVVCHIGLSMPFYSTMRPPYSVLGVREVDWHEDEGATLARCTVVFEYSHEQMCTAKAADVVSF